MKIVFSRHAEEKFEVLQRHGVVISRDEVIAAIQSPDLIDQSRAPLQIAQTPFDSTRVLRVVYKQDSSNIFVITFYPGRKSQYEKRNNNQI